MYARAVPMAVGKDVVLHEWTLYDVDEPCTIKVIVPNNEFPDSKINFNPFGLDFEMPFEVGFRNWNCTTEKRHNLLSFDKSNL
jgi:hypothetical protein